MSVLQRNVTRTILNSTETTPKTNTAEMDTLALNLQTTDNFYVGYKLPFASRYFGLSVLNTNASVLALSYWNGSDWAAVEDLIDQTNGFTKSGFVSWINQNDWVASYQAPVNNIQLFWIKITVSADLSSTTALQYLGNLFCDDNMVRAYYPELVSDARWLPPGREDLLEQYIAAKDLVVLRLKQDGIIDEEAQVLDINEVAVAAAHATAWIVKNPISLGDQERKETAEIWNNFIRELNKVKLNIDFDKDGIIEPVEENQGNIFLARG